MKAFAAILAIGLLAGLIHFGMMKGFEVAGAADGAHASHGSAGPACPIGYVCPILVDPSALAVAASSLGLLLAVAVLFSAFSVPAPALQRFAHEPWSPPPNHPKTLLAVFKRE